MVRVLTSTIVPSVLLLSQYLAHGAIVPPCRPLTPSCSPDAERCEFKLVASYHLTMTVHVPAAGPQWSPVAALPDGLWTKGEQMDCTAMHRRLSEKEAEHVIIGDGNPRMIFVINGSMPGPPLVVYEGQQIVVTYVNQLENEASILHFHGMHQRGTPWMDGTPVAQCPLHPGESFTYRFKAEPHGTFWYHAHLGSTQTMGLQGAFIVLPNPNSPQYRPRVDLPPMSAEYPMFVSDFMDKPSSEIGFYRRKNLGMYGYGLKNDICYNVTLQADKAFCAHWPFNSGIINGKGRHYKYDGFRPDNPYIPLEVFEVRRGSKYYFRMICSSQELTFSVSIDNHPLHVVATDGADIVTKTVDVIIISPGERYDFWIDAIDPEGLGLYWIRAVTMELFEGGWKPMAPHHTSAILRYEGAKKNTDPISMRRLYTPQRPGLVLNCPFRDYHWTYNLKCVNIDELRALEPDFTAWEGVDDDDVMDIFLQSQSISIPGGFGRLPAINGVRNKWPVYPSQVYKENVYDHIDKCDWEGCWNGCGDCTYLLKIPLGTVVHLVISNNAAIDVLKVTPHPTHIHGYTPQLVKLGWAKYDETSMRLIGSNDEITCNSLLCNDGAYWTNSSWRGGKLPGMPGPYAPKKDVVNLASGGYAVWRFKADNPGFWMVHCHIEFHLTDGMGVLLQIGEPDEMNPAPARMARCGNFQLEEDEYLAAVENPIPSKTTTPEVDDIPDVEDDLPVEIIAPDTDISVLDEIISAMDVVRDDLNEAMTKLRSFQTISAILGLICMLLALGFVILYRQYEHIRRQEERYTAEKAPLINH